MKDAGLAVAAASSSKNAGLFLRTIRLPRAVEPGKIEAVYNDGVLTVRLPKPADSQISSRRIEVKAA